MKYTVCYHVGNPLTGSSSTFPSDDREFARKPSARKHLREQGFAPLFKTTETTLRHGSTWFREFYEFQDGDHETPVASIEWSQD